MSNKSGGPVAGYGDNGAMNSLLELCEIECAAFNNTGDGLLD